MAKFIDIPIEIFQIILKNEPLETTKNLILTNKYFTRNLKLQFTQIDYLIATNFLDQSILLNGTEGRKFLSDLVFLKNFTSIHPHAMLKVWISLRDIFFKELDANLKLDKTVTEILFAHAELKSNGDRNSLFSTAAIYGDTALVDTLLKVSNKRKEDLRPMINYALGYASLYGQLDIVNRLIEETMKLNDFKFLAKMFTIALKNGAAQNHLFCVEYTLKKSAELNITLQTGQSLQLA
ncbi:hypothetical protein HDU92_001747, partial [Lobulomyces angularis]